MDIGTRISNKNPLPGIRDVKGDFVGGDFGEGFFFFEFAGADEGLFFGLDLLVEGLAGALFGALGDELALDGKLEDGFLHVRREALIEVLQAVPGFFVAVDIGQEFFDFGNDALLLGKGWEGQN